MFFIKHVSDKYGDSNDYVSSVVILNRFTQYTPSLF